MLDLTRCRLQLAPLALIALAACGGSRAPSPAPAPAAGPRRPVESGAAATTGPQFDQVKLYQQMGLLARGAPVPFVGGVTFYAASTADSTHAAVAITLANSALTFGRENDRFRAGYTVGITLASGGATVKQIEAHESVVVPSFRETSRVDESVIFQELFTLKPGQYRLTVTVRDDGSSRSGSEDVTLAVPVLGDGSLGTPAPFAQVVPRASRDSIPRILTSPAATATFGRDTAIAVYVEAYDASSAPRVPVVVTAQTENGRTLFSDTLSLGRRVNLYSGTVYVPIGRIGVGAVMLLFSEPGRTDTTRAPAFVGFGEDLPVASYEEMINYLKWFALPGKLQSLRDTAPEFRAAAWTKFIRESASAGGSSDALRDYFKRFALANTRYREDAIPGWMTDRGKVLLGLGEPDNLFEQNTAGMVSQRSRAQIWEYRGLGIQLSFQDQTGFGRWRLAPNSNVTFETAWRKKLQQ